MRKEIIICDECGKTLQENEVDKYYFDIWIFDLCSSCKEKKNGLKEKIEELNNMYDKRKQEIFDEYSIDKLIKKSDDVRW